MRELFVYYRVRAAQADAARALAIAFQAELKSRHPALTARLLRRDESAPAHDDETWMETYATDPCTDAAGVSAALQAEIETGARALEPFINGARHTEVFIACASR